MKERKAYQCDYCKLLRLTKRSIKIHEALCFYNPISQSCATCEYLSNTPTLNGKPLTEREESILAHDIEGTYTIVFDPDEGWDGKLLKDQYQYLYDFELESCCDSQKIILKNKLRTNCNKHKVK